MLQSVCDRIVIFKYFIFSPFLRFTSLKGRRKSSAFFALLIPLRPTQQHSFQLDPAIITVCFDSISLGHSMPLSLFGDTAACNRSRGMTITETVTTAITTVHNLVQSGGIRYAHRHAMTLIFFAFTCTSATNSLGNFLSRHNPNFGDLP